MVKTKLCLKCDEVKPLNAFHRRKASKDGRQDWCKACRRACDKARREKNKAKEAVSANSKVCLKCGDCKPASEFHKSRSKPDGLQDWCKVCYSAYMKAYHLERHEKTRVYNVEYYAEHKEELKANSRRWHLQLNYGISLADYDEMLEVQGGGCAICEKTPEENKRRLDVDHNHETGKVRGLLCNSCNISLGGFQDSVELLEQAILYLRFCELRENLE